MAGGEPYRFPRPGRSLVLRIASAAVMLPVAIAAVAYGRPWFDGLLALTAFLMAREWARMTGAGVKGATYLLAGVSLLLVLSLPFEVDGRVLLAAILGGTVLLYGLARLSGAQTPKLLAFGLPAVVLPCAAFVWLRANQEQGVETVLWLMSVVWATDTGAFFFGRTIGGPKLAPKLSPNKTWAGLLGGMLSAGLVGAGVAAACGGSPYILAPVAVVLAVVSQGGDLGESALKRRFGVKDSGKIIPGHGGVLDRVDGLMPVAPLLALLILVTGRSIMEW
ncbi:phosphatidate cytidylyltransferase [Lacibacterium aquatile]|uniref:Phosphatidate cytidylyltransferase n=1 Tax=Lacibacterium aquatile TaxID=1168082 RepID=A0ABW5DNY3_9PROT